MRRTLVLSVRYSPCQIGQRGHTSQIALVNMTYLTDMTVLSIPLKSWIQCHSAIHKYRGAIYIVCIITG